MSSNAHLSFHRVVSATAEVNHAEKTHWLSLEFVDDSGGRLSVALFNDAPEKLLEAIAAVSRALDDAGNEQPKCTYPNCDCEPNGEVGCNSPNAAAAGTPAEQPNGGA